MDLFKPPNGELRIMKFIQGVDDKIIAKVIEQEKKTEGGIIVPETVVNEPQIYCKIISVGENVNDRIKVGDTLVCHRNGGMDIYFQREILKVLKYDEIYGILEETK